jgi:hypothetical protein
VIYFTPFSVLAAIDNPWTTGDSTAAMLTGYLLLQGIGIVFNLTRAVQAFRREIKPGNHREFERPRNYSFDVEAPIILTPAPAKSHQPVKRHRVHVHRRHYTYHRKRPIIDEDKPILWKERYCPGGAAGAKITGFARFALVAAVGFCFMYLFVGAAEIMHETYWSEPPSLAARRELMRGAAFALGLFAIPSALRLAPAVSRERRRHTLDSLLSVPIERSAILWAKIRAAIEPMSAWAGLAVVAVGWAFTAEGNRLLGLVAALSVAASVLFIIGLGTLLTVYSTSEVRVFRFLMPAVAVVVGLPVAAFYCVDWRSPQDMITMLGSAAALLFLAALVFWKWSCHNLEAVN